MTEQDILDTLIAIQISTAFALIEGLMIERKNGDTSLED